MREGVRCFFCLRKMDGGKAHVVDVITELRLSIKVYACAECAEKARTAFKMLRTG